MTWPLLYKLFHNKHTAKKTKYTNVQVKKKKPISFPQEILHYWMQQWKKRKEKHYIAIN